jgi:hypothetical protein
LVAGILIPERIIVANLVPANPASWPASSSIYLIYFSPYITILIRRY